MAKKGKGLKRSRKQWEISIAEHIGKFIDRLTLSEIRETLVYGGVGYLGYNVGGPMGALTGMVSLKLATSNNEAAGVAGTVGLAYLGVASFLKPFSEYVEEKLAETIPEDERESYRARLEEWRLEGRPGPYHMWARAKGYRVP